MREPLGQALKLKLPHEPRVPTPPAGVRAGSAEGRLHGGQLARYHLVEAGAIAVVPNEGGRRVVLVEEVEEGICLWKAVKGVGWESGYWRGVVRQ